MKPFFCFSTVAKISQFVRLESIVDEQLPVRLFAVHQPNGLVLEHLLVLNVRVFLRHVVYRL